MNQTPWEVFVAQRINNECQAVATKHGIKVYDVNSDTMKECIQFYYDGIINKDGFVKLIEHYYKATANLKTLSKQLIEQINQDLSEQQNS